MSLRFVVLGVALVAAGGAGYLAMNMSKPAPVVAMPEAAGPRIEVEEVLVAAQNIPIGSPIDGSTRWQEWPRGAVGAEYITRSARPSAESELAGSVVRSSIAEGEPIRPIKLLGADQSFMSSILPSGKRAVATEIAADTSAGGFILPDDYVDVIMTTRPRTAGANPVTETILQNIRILAIDQTIREDEQGRLVQVGRTATLELTPSQAEIITAAQQMADRLTLALRSVQDVDPDAATKSADHLLSGGMAKGVVIIKGNQMGMTQGQ